MEEVRAAAEEVQTRFSLGRHVERVYQLYSNILSDRQQSGGKS